MIVPTHNHFPGILTYRGNGAMKILKARFEKFRLIERVKQSTFGAFFKADELQFSGVMFHELMLRKINVSENKCEVHFLFGKKTCRFGKEEFCLITGLNYTKRPSEVEMKKHVFEDNRLIREYFNSKQTIPLSLLLDAINKCDNVEDLYKLGLCYFFAAYEKEDCSGENGENTWDEEGHGRE